MDADFIPKKINKFQGGKIMKEGLTTIIQSAIRETLSNTHTSSVAKITKITGSTISVKLVFKRVINNVEIELPEFSEVPIFTLQGGSNYRIMPLSIGDYVLLIFSERCIDDWYYGADNKKPRENRMHDYSDAIAIVGLNNVKNAINIPTGFEEVKGNIEHTGNNKQTGNYDLTGNNTTLGTTKTTDIIVSNTIKVRDTMLGVTGSFRSDDNKTITVTDGIITGIN